MPTRAFLADGPPTHPTGRSPSSRSGRPRPTPSGTLAKCEHPGVPLLPAGAGHVPTQRWRRGWGEPAAEGGWDGGAGWPRSVPASVHVSPGWLSSPGPETELGHPVPAGRRVRPWPVVPSPAMSVRRGEEVGTRGPQHPWLPSPPRPCVPGTDWLPPTRAIAPHSGRGPEHLAPPFLAGGRAHFLLRDLQVGKLRLREVKLFVLGSRTRAGP